MSTLSLRDRKHIFEQLRKGLVPERGLETFAEGISKARGEIQRQLELAGGGGDAAGEGGIKFLRGGYGCGKTFMARLSLADAQAQNFATSFVVVSDNDLRFHRFDDVYRKVVTELGTRSCPRGALGDILDRWIGRVEESLIATGADESAPDFPALVRTRLQEILLSMTGGKAPQDFVRVVQTIFDLKAEGDLAEAGALLSWLAGSGNVSANAKRRAGIKGDITSRDALEYLRGVLEIVKAAGYKGLVVVIDEAETILRMRTDSRHKSLNGIRQIADAAGSYPGLLWLFTGTPDFFDSRHGVGGLAPLHERIRFMVQGRLRLAPAAAAGTQALRRRPTEGGGFAPARPLPGERAGPRHRACDDRVHHTLGRAGHDGLPGRRRGGAAAVPARVRPPARPGRRARRLRPRDRLRFRSGRAAAGGGGGARGWGERHRSVRPGRR
jgi:hypothetical protein